MQFKPVLVKGQLYLLSHCSVGHKSRWVELSSLLTVLQGQSQVKVWAGLHSYLEALGKSPASKLIQVPCGCRTEPLFSFWLSTIVCCQLPEATVRSCPMVPSISAMENLSQAKSVSRFDSLFDYLFCCQQKEAALKGSVISLGPPISLS